MPPVAENQPASTEGQSIASDVPSVAEYMGSVFGDIAPRSEPEPAAPETPSTGEAASSEPGDSATGESAVPTQPGAPADPNAAAPAAPTIDDATQYQPFSYVLNGEEKTVDGIKIIPDAGAVVDLEYLPALQQLHARSDYLATENDRLARDNESYGKLTEWRTTRDGKETVLTGREAEEAKRITLAQLSAETMTLRALFDDPGRIASLLVADENGQITWNRQAVDALRTQINLAQREHTLQARDAFGRLVPANAQPTPAAETAATAGQVDGAAVARYIAESNKFAGLSDQDYAWAATLAPKFYHAAATPADVRTNPALKVGSPWIEQGFVDLLKERATRNASTTQAVSAATQASRENAAKLAAAARGRTAPAAQPNKPTPRNAPEYTPEGNAETAFANRETAMARAMRAAG